MKGTRFDGLLPAGSVVVEAEPSMWDGGLWEAELPHVQHCVPKRRREFTAGRNCVRRALALLGREAAAIPVGAGRAPVLPAGLVGSITHTATYCAAALLDASAGQSIGIDAEPQGPLGPGIESLVLRSVERERVARLREARSGMAWDKLVFSAKEAFHKALFRRCPVTLDFLDAELQLDCEAESFGVTVLREDVPALSGRNRFQGRFRFVDGLVLTTAVVPLA